MKRKFKTELIVLFILPSLFILAGCEKYVDYLHPNHPPGQVGKYEIKMVTIKLPETNITDTIHFYYNEYGNPIKGLRSDIRTGAANYLFKYDRFQRMTALIAAYGLTETTGVETWTKYTYDVMGRIVKDSVFVFPEIVNGQPVLHSHSALTVSLYEYDAKDRIKKVTWLRNNIEPFIYEYSYDSKGNRVGATYDNKVNYHLTNKIWMFLAKDYSVNNPLVGPYTYNKVGLPLTIDCHETFAVFLDMPFVPIRFTNATITYNK